MNDPTKMPPAAKPTERIEPHMEDGMSIAAEQSLQIASRHFLFGTPEYFALARDIEAQLEAVKAEARIDELEKLDSLRHPNNPDKWGNVISVVNWYSIQERINRLKAQPLTPPKDTGKPPQGDKEIK